MLALVLKLQVERDGAFRALAKLAVHLDLAAHQPHDALGDGHAEPRARNVVQARVVGPFEGREQPFLKGLVHAHAVVLDLELELGVVARLVVVLPDSEMDGAPFGGIFDRVGHDIGEDLLDTQGIANDVLMGEIAEQHLKGMALFLQRGADHGEEIFHQLGQIHLAFRQRKFPALDFRHVQHFVDQG